MQRLGRSVDGFVLSASRLPDDELRRAAELSPIVLVNRAAPGLPCVVADYDSGTRQIVDHLASFGHESLVFARRPGRVVVRCPALARAPGRPPGAGLGRRGSAPTPDAGRRPAAADAVLAAGATAVVCHNDMLAIGAVRRLAERGKASPAT